MLKTAAILHHPQSEGAAVFARQLSEELVRRGVETHVADVWDGGAEEAVAASSMVICIGGDGSVLRTARLAMPRRLPVLGVNMGRLGFLTGLGPADLFKLIERLVDEDWRIEERLMVRAELEDGQEGAPLEFHGLNDVVVSRQAPGRPIYVEVSIDSARLGLYRCDGIIVATPTGSTGYSMSAGGPILAPTEHHLVLTPVSAHLALGRSLVLQPDSEVELRVTTDHGAFLSVDGQDDLAISTGACVTIRVSEHVTRFVRFDEPATFYAELAAKLEHQMSSSIRTT